MLLDLVPRRQTCSLFLAQSIRKIRFNEDYGSQHPLNHRQISHYGTSEHSSSEFYKLFLCIRTFFLAISEKCFGNPPYTFSS